MTHIDDRWKDNYDAWELACPYDDPPDDDCYHEDYEADWQGFATCDRCGVTWWLTEQQIKADREASAAYDRYFRRVEREEKIAAWINWFAFWRRWRKPVPIDDEIPF